jgi:tetratricopeptide (TPR) repeat protein
VYLGLLLRKGTLEGFRRGRDWFVYADSLEAFLASPRKSGPKGPRKPPAVLQARNVDQRSKKDGPDENDDVSLTPGIGYDGLQQGANATTIPTNIFDIATQLLKLAQQEYGWSPQELYRRLDKAMKRLQIENLRRREIIAVVTGLPLATLGLESVPLLPVEELLPQAKASLLTAWKLARGSELAMAQAIVASYIPALLPLATQPSNYRGDTAKLLAQNHMLSGLMAMHLNDLDERELSCQHAVHYAEISGDLNLITAAHRWLGCTYYYQRDNTHAMQEYKHASAYLDDVLPLLRSSVLVETAVIQARQKQKNEALHSLGQAQETFFTESSEDQNLLYIGHDIGVLVLWTALTYYELGDYRRSLETLLEIDGLQPKQPISERIRLQFLNHQALAATRLNEMEQARTYIEAAAVGAIALGSKLRYTEAKNTYQIMEFIWPDEDRVQEIKSLFIHKL